MKRPVVYTRRQASRLRATSAGTASDYAIWAFQADSFVERVSVYPATPEPGHVTVKLLSQDPESPAVVRAYIAPRAPMGATVHVEADS